MHKITVHDLGLIKYADALLIQTNKFDELLQQKINRKNNNADAHSLFLCEHLPVITLGKSAKTQNLLLSEDLLHEKALSFFYINRGGDVTFHGPGQIMGYPIMDLEYFSSDIKLYMRMLKSNDKTIAQYDIVGYRIEDATGVWVNSIHDGKPKK